MNRYIVFLSLVVLSGARSAAQDNTIRVNTRLVEINVIVRDKNGPVADLTRSDFTVLDNGKTRPIEVFSISGAPSARQTGIPSPAKPVYLPVGVVSNRPASFGVLPSSTTVILFDVLNTDINFQQEAVRQLIAYLKSIRPEDRTSLYFLANKLEVLQDFTNDPERLAHATTGLKSGDIAAVDVKTAKELVEVLSNDPRFGSDPDMANAMMITNTNNRAGTTLAALELIAKHLSGVPGKKNLVWMSGSFPFTPEPVKEGGTQVNVSGNDIGVRAKIIEVPENYSVPLARAVRALNGANVAVYPVDVHGLIPPSFSNLVDGKGLKGPQRTSLDAAPVMPPPEVMQRLADATGGKAAYFTNDLQGAVRTAVSDGELSYALGFYSTADASDTTFHALSVKVNRRGAEIRHRAGYYPADLHITTEREREAVIGEALGNPLDVSQIGLLATAVPDSSIPGNYRIAISVNAQDIRLEQHNNRYIGTLILASRLESSKEKSVKSSRIPLSVPGDQLQTVMKDGIPLRSSLPGKAGDRLRIVVQDQVTGSVGSLRVPLPR